MPKRSIAVLACLVLVYPAAVLAEDRLAAEFRVGKDPLIVVLARLDSLMSPVDSLIDMATRVDAELTAEKIEAGFAKIDAEIGFSLRDDLLAQLGPEFGLVIDLAAVDTVVEQATGFPGTASELLAGVGVFAQVRDAERVDFSLRKLALSSDEGVEIVHDSEGLARIRFPMKAPLSGADSTLEVVYGIRDGWLALGLNADWVRTTLDGPPAGQRLTAGADYQRVMSHLDANPDMIVYVNLPEVLTQVQGSNMIEMMLGANEQAQRMMDLFATEQYLGMGWGYTTIEVDGGARASNFGPAAFSGPAMYTGIIAAVAIPNFLNAVDRGKQKRSMADVRTIGTAMESFRIDTDRYAATDGWRMAEALVESLQPVYIRTLPLMDGWGNPFRVVSDGESYTLVSAGKDGELDQDWLQPFEPGATNLFDNDIVFRDGQFVRWPEGVQE